MAIEKVYLNILNHPRSMNIQLLPKELKQLAQDNLEQYKHWPKVEDVIKYMWTEDLHTEHWKEFVDYNLKMDELQRGKLLEACPEFEGYIDV